MSYSDVFKSSFLESMKEFSAIDTLIGLLCAAVLGLFIYYIYRKCIKGVMYSSSLAMTLVGLTLVTTLVIMAVTSNVVLSLGMVGALSIVRFRAAIKDPMEIVFLFWSIACGIVIGAGMIPLAFIGSAIIGMILVVFAHRKTFSTPYMLVLSLKDDAGEKRAMDCIKESVKQSSPKSKTVSPQGIELTVEVRLKDEESSFVNRLAGLEGVRNATLVSYNGEYMA